MHTSFKIYNRLLAKLPENVRTILQTVILSFAAALGAVAFMSLMNAMFRLLYIRASALSQPVFVALSFAFTMISSLAVSLLLRQVPVAAGSGIPQVKAAYWKELGYIPIKTVLVKFVAGIVSIGGGASLGREGPTVFIGSGVASFLSGITGSPKRQRRAAAAIGASAGLAAAFNTPLAAITFSIEELINDLNTRYLGRVVLASLFGPFTVHALLGKQPAFVLPQVATGSWKMYALTPVVAFLASYLGVTFQKSTLRLRLQARKTPVLPTWALPCVGGFITWVIGTAVYLSTGKIGIFGLGYNDLSHSLVNGCVWWIAGILVAGKLAATIVSYGFGGCGGIFSPTLFIGGMCGACISGIAGLWIPTTTSDLVILSTVGMSACLGAVIRAPLTSTLIVFEMTHQFEVVPGLMLSAVISRLVSRFAGVKHNFYDELLLQDGHELIKIKPPRDLSSWHNLPVSHIMNPKPVVIDSRDAKQFQNIVSTTPYHCFPYVKSGAIEGIVTREAMEEALRSGQAPEVSGACVTKKTATVRQAADNFMNSLHGFMIIVDGDETVVAGILTLHDLLRAQAAVAE
jgi:CIC family chloride channel protein